MPPSPASIIADALSSLTKAANLAFATVEEQAKSDIAEARRERDDAVNELHEIQLQEKEWHRRVDGWKTSLDKSDATIQHQSETITRLKEEVQQWRNQLMRLEATTRREIQDWKDQYLRAEDERCHLSSRVDELLAEHMASQAHPNGQAQRHPPRKLTTANIDPSLSSMASKRAGSTAIASSSRIPENPEFDAQTSRKPKGTAKKLAGARARTETLPRTQNHTTDNTARTPKHKSVTEVPEDVNTVARVPQPRPASTPRQSISQRELDSVAPRQTVLRRVHAVLEVPVKEESDAEDELALLSDAQSVGSNYQPNPKRRASTSKNAQRTKARRRSSTKSKQVIQSDVSQDEDEEEEVALTMIRTSRGRQIPPEDDDEDELIIGAEDNHHELYGIRPVIVTSEVDTPKRGRTAGRTVGTSKKRKLDGGSVPRGPTAKVARKKQ